MSEGINSTQQAKKGYVVETAHHVITLEERLKGREPSFIGRSECGTLWTVRLPHEEAPPQFRDRELQILQELKRRQGHRYVHTDVEPIIRPDTGIALPYVKGCDLQQYSMNNSVSVDEVFSITEWLAEGYSWLHEQGYIHRDIKPANILLRNDSSNRQTAGAQPKIPLIIDFGFAAPLDRRMVFKEKSNFICGSPRFLAPEVYLQGTYSPASDVYALGVALYNVITKTFPHPGDSVPAVAHGIIHERHQPIQQYEPAAAPALITLVDACLAKDPKQRPTMDDIQAYCEDITSRKI